MFDGVERKSAPKAATYKSSVNVYELEALAASGNWCFPLTDVKLRAPKRPRLVSETDTTRQLVLRMHSQA